MELLVLLRLAPLGGARLGGPPVRRQRGAAGRGRRGVGRGDGGRRPRGLRRAPAHRRARARRRAGARRAGRVGATPTPRRAEALREGNRAYEARFGHIYLVFASGRTAPPSCSRTCGRGWATTRATELAIAAEEQRTITRAAAAEAAGVVTAVTTHVLDTARGRPAAGVGVVLEAWEDGGWRPLATAMTDDDGRAPDLGLVDAGAGTHRLVFATGDVPRAPRRSSPRSPSSSRCAARSTCTSRCCSRPRLLRPTGGADGRAIVGANQYGKAEVHMVTVTRDGAAAHDPRPHGGHRAVGRPRRRPPHGRQRARRRRRTRRRTPSTRSPRSAGRGDRGVRAAARPPLRRVVRADRPGPRAHRRGRAGTGSATTRFRQSGAESRVATVVCDAGASPGSCRAWRTSWC